MIIRELEYREEEILKIFAKTSQFSFYDIEIAYRKLESYDDIEKVMILCSKLGVGLYDVVQYIEKVR